MLKSTRGARRLRHPLKLQMRGWAWHGRDHEMPPHITSPRGAVFVLWQSGRQFFAEPYHPVLNRPDA